MLSEKKRMTKYLIYAVRWYQKHLSPIFPGTCRFTPTCSNYMIEALLKHGLKGVLMGIARFLRCQPFSKIGPDLVPNKFSIKRNKTE